MNSFFSLVGRRYLFILMDFSVQIYTLETDQEKSPAFLVKVCWMEIQHKHTNCYITSLKTCFLINLKMKKCINVFSVKEFSPKISIFIIDFKINSGSGHDKVVGIRLISLNKNYKG